MLFYQTIDPKVLELLQKLMNIDTFSKLRLVGGTSLALQIGHRQSIDLDMFGLFEVDEYELPRVLNTLGSVKLINRTKNIWVYLINDIKVDFVNYPYRWINELKIEDNIRLAGLPDIVAMKLAAITGRGTKKDFIDLYFLLKQYSLSEMFEFYNSKFHDASDMLVLKSLTYFDDAEEEETPKMLVGINWNDIKTKIIQEVRNYSI